MGEAVTQMDQATQQNAALVEEMAAAASALNAQAGELVNAVAVFKLDANASTRSASPMPRSAPAPAARAPIPAPQRTAAKSVGSAAGKKASAPASLQAPKAASKPAAPAPAPAAKGGSEDDWESF